LLRWNKGTPQIHLVHRFPNAPIQENGGLRWNIGYILVGLEHGLQECAKIASEGIAAIAVDGWAVDYVRLDARAGAWPTHFAIGTSGP
jgi:rhamnulokinase